MTVFSFATAGNMPSATMIAAIKKLNLGMCRPLISNGLVFYH